MLIKDHMELLFFVIACMVGLQTYLSLSMNHHVIARWFFWGSAYALIGMGGFYLDNGHPRYRVIASLPRSSSQVQ